ncbi:hypothetical protein CSA80_01695 [Candidatus Saccharibacteria bacterium]|nr:MAG: hypothetical protein CSA80_01695 [Candidatus Saccharibacteria bacterium]
MSEVQPVTSLSEIPNWGGSYPAAHEFSTLDGLENNDGRLDEAMSAAGALLERWHGGQPVGLYLYGPPGTGKTHFAVGLGRALAERDVLTAYVHLPTFSDRQAEHPAYFTRDPDRPERNSKVTSIFSPRVHTTAFDMAPRGPSALVLDDYSPGDGHPVHQKVAFAAIRAAYERGGLVIVTSNTKDPFGLLETPGQMPEGERELMDRDYLERHKPDELQNLDEQRRKAADAISDAMRSRIAAAFKFVEFTSPKDWRVENSFWG